MNGLDLVFGHLNGVIGSAISAMFSIGGSILSIAACLFAINGIRDFVSRVSDARGARQYIRDERKLKYLEREQYRINRSVESYRRRLSERGW
jgi:hypothetical protein